MVSSKKFGVVLLAVGLLAMLLRPPIAIVGPLLGQITETYRLDAVMVSVLNSLPLLCFGLGAFFAPRLERSMGMRSLVIGLTALLTASIASRGWVGEEMFLVGTFVLSLCISLANVLLPTLVRMLFPTRIGLVTGFYVTVMAVAASFSAATAVPLADLVGSWQVALSLWALPGFFAAILWFLLRSALPTPVLSSVKSQSQIQTSNDAHQPQQVLVANSKPVSVYRQSIAWLLVAFFGIQSLGFYSVLGWLAPALVSAGMTQANAGLVLALATGLGIPLGLITSTVLHKIRSISTLNLASTATALSGMSLFVFLIWVGVPNLSIGAYWLILVAAVVLLSFGQAVTFPIALALISMKAATNGQTTQLSAMAQGVGYCFAFVGSFALGYLGTVFGFGLAFGVLALLTTCQLWLSWVVAKPNKLRP